MCAGDAKSADRGFHWCERGATAVEFAIIGPMLLVILLGVLSYGGYFWMAHSVQQLANDSARAALSGLTASERLALAEASLATQSASYVFVEAGLAALALVEDSDSMVVTVSYDASASPFFTLSGLVPMPASTIEQQAAVRLGGY